MNQQEMIEAAAGELLVGLDGAAQYVFEWIAAHPDAAVATLCRKVADRAGIPDSWNALRGRVQRKQQNGNSHAESGSTRALSGSRVRHARSALREADPDQLAEIMEDLPADRRAAVVRAAVPSPERRSDSSTGPTFLDLLVRVNSTLTELEGMVGTWRSLAAVPPEFSRDSFTDVVAKALRIQDRFDELAAAIADEDEDEFMKIVRNFGATADVR